MNEEKKKINIQNHHLKNSRVKGGGRDRVGVPARAVFSGESTAATRSPDLEGNKKREETKPENVLLWP